ncbi:MAG TPA: class I SAM-dependent methyltransferase [Gemmatimonadales bacterium]|nr:class I SAM-dependent methyltransferase [Gemmatimonadales bacterium]
MSLLYYRQLLRQSRRIEAFRRAIRHGVRPGDRVLEIGSGLGTFAFFAADAGAARVWAVDGHPVIHVARTIARLNGYADRVTFLRGWLPDAVPDEPANVVIFEDFPPRLLDASAWRLLRGVRRTALAPGARFVPAGADLFLAPVSSEDLLRELTLDGEPPLYGLDWSAGREAVANTPHRVNVPREALLHAGARVGCVDFARDVAADQLGGVAEISVDRAAAMHGLVYWFELNLGGGERLSNAPGETPGSWGHLFLPIDPPLALAAGDRLTVSIRAEPLPDQAPGWLAWDVASRAGRRRGHEFLGTPMSVTDLLEASRDSVPELTPRGKTALRVLALADGTRSVSDIAHILIRDRPDLSQAEAERLVIAHLRGSITSKAPGAEETGYGF